MSLLIDGYPIAPFKSLHSVWATTNNLGSLYTTLIVMLAGQAQDLMTRVLQT